MVRMSARDCSGSSGTHAGASSPLMTIGRGRSLNHCSACRSGTMRSAKSPESVAKSPAIIMINDSFWLSKTRLYSLMSDYGISMEGWMIEVEPSGR